MSIIKYSLTILLGLTIFICQSQPRQATQAKTKVVIDGKGDENVWQKSEWLPMDQNWVGGKMSSGDFAGKYKLAWDSEYLYVLAEIEDDTLIDIYEDPLVQYWDDDCLEIFIDEDASGGGHQYNHNAFAYHIGLDYSVADIDIDEKPILLNDHIITKRTSLGNIYTWEVAIRIFDDSFAYGQENSPVSLASKKIMGFAIAYCDNDYSNERENFIGSEKVEGEDKNRGWIDAGIFGKIELK